MLEPVEFEPGAYGFQETEPADVRLESAEETIELGRELVGELEAGDVVGLVGQLGAGKTTLVGGMVEGLGRSGPVRSPTYTLVNRYDTDPPLVHADLYRLESVDDLETTGYWDDVRRGDAILCVEWLDRVQEAWPGEGLVVELEHRDEGRAAQIWCSARYRDAVDAIENSLGGAV